LEHFISQWVLNFESNESPWNTYATVTCHESNKIPFRMLCAITLVIRHAEAGIVDPLKILHILTRHCPLSGSHSFECWLHEHAMQGEKSGPAYERVYPLPQRWKIKQRKKLESSHWVIDEYGAGRWKNFRKARGVVEKGFSLLKVLQASHVHP